MSASYVSSSQPLVEGGAKLRDRMAFWAVLSGSAVALAAGLMFNLLGLGVGMTTVDVVARDTPGFGTAGLISALWVMAATALSLGAGGYVAARLSGNTDRTDSALHGLAVWGIAMLISASMISGAATRTVSGLFQGASSVIGTVSQGAGDLATAAAEQINPQAMLEQAQRSLSGAENPQAMTTEARAAEIGSILARRAATGEYGTGQQERLRQLVAAEAGITPEQARERIAAYEAEAQRLAAQAEAQARAAADAAADAAAIGAFWAFATLLLGAAAAAIGGMAGAREMLRTRQTTPLRD